MRASVASGEVSPESWRRRTRGETPRITLRVVSCKTAMHKVVVQDLQKRYDDVLAAQGVSFEIEDGEIFGLLGPNGSGKTTTLECVIGLRQPDAGRIEV